MSIAFAISVFVLSYVSVWLLLRRRLFDAVLGFGLIAHVGNLIMLASGGFGDRAPVVTSTDAIDADRTAEVGSVADPLPQALILTAIVISMAMLIYLVALFRRSAESGEETWS